MNLLAFAAAVAALLLPAATSQAQTLQPSANGRYVQWSDGTPVFLLSDTCWLLPGRYTAAEITAHVNTRKAQGFTALQMSACFPEVQNGQALQDINSIFTGSDLAQPIESYFAMVDAKVQQVTAAGMIVIINPFWKKTYDTWLDNNGPTKCRDYGKWFATRYRNNPRVAYFVGGDDRPEPIREEMDAMGLGIQDAYSEAGLPPAIVAYHGDPGQTSREAFSTEGWVTLDWTYNYSPPLSGAEGTGSAPYVDNWLDWVKTPAKPIMFGEGWYDRDNGATTSSRWANRQMCRRQAWWSTISGAIGGYAYGAEPIWTHGYNGITPATAAGWNSGQDAARMKAFLLDIAWTKLQPDINHTFLTGGYGTSRFLDYALAAVASDSSCAVVYTPTAHTLSLQMPSSGSSYTLRWFDPSNGTFLAGSTPAASGAAVSIATPGNNASGAPDWVLLATTGQTSRVKPRTIITTDGEVDDRSTMIRALLYSSDFDIAGIVEVNSRFQKNGHSGETWLEDILDRYETVRPNLLVHNATYPTAAYLRSICRVGNENTDDLWIAPPVMATKNTAGEQLIISTLLDGDPRPVHVQCWGGVNTTASALWRLKSSGQYTTAQYNYAVSRIRIYSVSVDRYTPAYQDGGGTWIEDNIPGAYINDACRWRLVWDYNSIPPQTVNPSDVYPYMTSTWLDANVKAGHGTLGAYYPQSFVSEGDTPSFLHLIDNGLEAQEDYTLGGWGGRSAFTIPSKPKYLTDRNLQDDGDANKMFWRWVIAAQNDFAARMDWCVATSFATANHPPIARVNGALTRTVLPGETVALDATGTADPDGNALGYDWWQYHDADSAVAQVTINNRTSPTGASFVVPSEGGKQIHIILEVTDNGSPPLKGYRRIIFNIVDPAAAIPPDAPGGLSVTAASPAQINLAWTDNSTNESSFLIERSLDNIAFTQIASVAAGVTSYPNTGLAAETLYYYRVRASNQFGDSAYTAVASATTPAVPPSSDVFKANNTANLNLGTSWTGSNPPGAGDVAVWNATVAAANTVALGVDVSWSGIRIADPAGLVTINAGNTLTLGIAGLDLGAATQSLTFNNAVTLGAPQVWNVASGRTVTVGGTFTAATGNGLTKTGLGQLTLNPVILAAGAPDGITINQGTVKLNGGGSTVPIKLNGGTYDMGAALGTPVDVGAGGGTISVLSNRTLSGAVTGSGTANLTLSSQLSLNGSIAGFSGGFHYQSSASGIRLNDANFAGGANVSFNLGISTGFLNRNNSAATVSLGSLAGGPSTVLGVTTGSVIWSIGGKNLDSTFSGRISGAAALTKSGSGALTLSGTNTHTGATTIAAGTLRITGLLTNASTVEVLNGATLHLTGALTTGTLTIRAGGKLTGGGAVNAAIINEGLIEATGAANFAFNGAITNSGTMRFTGGAGFSRSGGTFVNSGVLDIITAGAVGAPTGGAGEILTAQAVRVSLFDLAGGMPAITILTHAGHTYQLQRNPGLSAASWENIGSPRSGSGAAETFVDSVPPAEPKLFYRILVSP